MSIKLTYSDKLAVTAAVAPLVPGILGTVVYASFDPLMIATVFSAAVVIVVCSFRA